MHHPALILIDVQQGFAHADYFGGGRNNPAAEQHCGALLAAWRAQHLPVFHIRHSSSLPHSPLHASHPGFQFAPEVMPQAGEILLTKTVNSAFIGTDLHEKLQAQGITTLVMAGITTDHCVSTSVRMAGNLGYQVYCVHDACATFARRGIRGETYDADTIHYTALASLHEEFAQVVASETLFAQLAAAARGQKP